MVSSKFLKRGLSLSIVAAGVVLSAGQAQALLLYSSRATFQAAYPGLPLEDFVGTGPSGGFTAIGMGEPVDSSTNNGIYLPGDILPGVQIRSTFGTGLLYGDAPNFGTSGATEFIGTNQNAAGNGLEILFTAGGINAAGLDIFGEFANVFGNSTTVQVFDTLNNLVGSTTLAAGQGGTFLGVASATLIGRIRVESLDGLGRENGEIIDNLEFGVAQVNEPTTGGAPEPATLALLGLGLAGLGFMRRRRAV